MKKFLFASIIGLTAIAGTFSAASAAENMADSKYCRNNIYDVLCMTPEMMKMRSEMMAMTKEKVMENRSKYCTEHATDNDPVCKKEVMGDMTGY